MNAVADESYEKDVRLILKLIAALHSVNLSSEAIEDRLEKVARRLNGQLRILSLQSYAAVEYMTSEKNSVRICRFEFNTHWNLRKLNDLLESSDAFISGNIDTPRFNAELDHILSRKPAYTKAVVVLCYAVYGAAVAVRVGGAGVEMIAAAIVGTLAGMIHFGTVLSRKIDLQKSFIGAFVGSLAGLALTLVLPPFDFSRAVFGGITLLVPAMVVTIGTIELVSESVESGVARLSYGLIRFLMMAFGVSAAIALWSLFADLPAGQAAERLPFPFEFAAVAIGGVALLFCMQGRKRDLPWIVSGVLIAFSAQELSKVIFGANGSPFLTSFVLGLAGVFTLGRMGRPPHILIMPGLLQIVPGFIGSQAILVLLGLGASAESSEETFFRVLLIALEIVFGLAVATLFLKRKKEPISTR